MIEANDIMASVIGGIIVSLITGAVYLFWNIKCKPYILGKNSKFNSKEKKRLKISVGTLSLAFILLILGGMLSYPFIYGYTYIENPVFEEYLKHHWLSAIVLVIGVGVLVAGGAWIISGFKELWSLFHPSSSHKNS